MILVRLIDSRRFATRLVGRKTSRGSWLFLLLALCVSPTIAAERQAQDWPAYAGSAAGTQFSSLDQVNRGNVGQLKPLWHYQLPPSSPALDSVLMQIQMQPLVIGETLYGCTPTGRAFALDANTGEQRWFFDNTMQTLPDKGYPTKCRGVAFWQDTEIARDENAACEQRIVFSSADAELIALDANTGVPCADFGVAGRVRLYLGVEGFLGKGYAPTSAPLILGDHAIVGARVDDNMRVDAPSGVIRAYNVRSGELAWAWNPVAPGQSPFSVDDDGIKRWRAGTVNSWAPMSADLEHGLIYVPTGNPSPDLYGGMREGIDHYGSSVVALDAQSGEVRWHFQTTHHDIWDYDVPAIPTLFQSEGVGGGVPALAQPTKLGHIFLLNRLTGEPLYPVEERAVPQGAVDGEYLSPTQPFPTHPQSIHTATLEPWGFTPFDRNACKKKIARFRWEGPFTPPSIEGSLLFPGTSGGPNWGSAAIDEANGVLYINQSHMAWVVKMIPRAELANYDAEQFQFPAQLFPMDGTPYAALRYPLMSPLGAPCNKPPWGSLSAVDLRSGEMLWQVPLGTTRDLAPWPLWLKLGTPNFGGVLATAGGVVFSTGTTDHFHRAFDAQTGEEIWKFRTTGISWATPMTYSSGPALSQKIVFAINGAGSGESQFSLVAYALPD